MCSSISETLDPDWVVQCDLLVRQMDSTESMAVAHE